MKKHFMISETDGALYDTRVDGWHKLPPLRENYARHHRYIETVADLKAALRAGPYAWPGGYDILFCTDDGEALTHGEVIENLDAVMWSIRNDVNDGWLVRFLMVDYGE